MVPEKEPKDSTWKKNILHECITALETGNIPEVQYPIDEELESKKAEERAKKFNKVGNYT